MENANSKAAAANSTPPTSLRSTEEQTEAGTPTKQAVGSIAATLQQKKTTKPGLLSLPREILEKTADLLKDTEPSKNTASAAASCSILHSHFGLPSATNKAVLDRYILKPNTYPPKYEELTTEQFIQSLEAGLNVLSLKQSDFKLELQLNKFSYQEVESNVTKIIAAKIETPIEITINAYKGFSLPENLGSLATLQKLELSHCAQLTELPESLSELANLQILNLIGCFEITHLPESLGDLAILKKLNLIGFHKLKALPNLPKNLTSIDIIHCNSFTTLPQTLGPLPSLQKLNIANCPITNLPEYIGSFSALKTLKLWGCLALQTLPESIGHLTNLKTLNLTECPARNNLPSTLTQRTDIKIITAYPQLNPTPATPDLGQRSGPAGLNS